MFHVFNLRKSAKKLLSLFAVISVAALVLCGFYIYFPLKHIDLIREYSEKYSVDTALVCAVINAESRFNKEATSHKGASGLMQITEPTGNWIAEEIGIDGYDYSQIYDPEININIGCYYLNKLSSQYNSDVTLTLAAYNAGQGNVRKWLDNPEYSKDGKTLDVIPFKETRNYIKKVNFNFNIYRYVLKVI